MHLQFNEVFTHTREGGSKGGREQGRMRVRERAQHLPLITLIVFIVYLPDLPPPVDQLNKQVSHVSVGLLLFFVTMGDIMGQHKGTKGVTCRGKLVRMAATIQYPKL